ncbi:MAG: response regulator transcription factor [Candidatus Gastranaerophilales bacterium]|nr:response regulator transcription factor [Candidatus Gastranaerophilales bacterium]
MMEKIKVLIVEDQTLMRLGLQMGLEKAENITVIGEAADGKKGLELTKELLPDVVLMDIGLPEMDGIEATRLIKEQNLPSKVLIFTSREQQEDVFEAFKAGADGYIMKGANEEQLVKAITDIAQGKGWIDPSIAKLVIANVKTENKMSAPNPMKYKEYNLTSKECEVLKLIADGLDNDEIAEKLVVEKSTVKAHVHNLLGKLYVKNKHQATALAYKEGLV